MLAQCQLGGMADGGLIGGSMDLADQGTKFFEDVVHGFHEPGFSHTERGKGFSCNLGYGLVETAVEISEECPKNASECAAELRKWLALSFLNRRQQR